MGNEKLTQNKSAECCGEKPDVKSSSGLNPLQNTPAEKNGANINGTAKPVPKKKKSNDEFRRKYFDYYDDVKDRTKGKEDW